MRNLHIPGRSTVHALNGMAATSHPLAAAAAIDMLKRGGNAVDAAIAASAVLCVVEPMSTGMGGDCFAIYAPRAGDKLIGLNGSGRSAKAASAAALRDQGMDEISVDSVHSITAPGAVDAWCRLAGDHGTMGINALLAPAIAYAEDGFAVSPRVARDWNAGVERLSAHEGSKQVYLPGGRAPVASEVFKSPALAKTLRAVAERGRAGFYEGQIPETMVNFLASQGSLLTLDDLAATACTYVDPIRTGYRGYELAELPPNGHGLTALIMMNILEDHDLSSMDPCGAERLHLEAEASRLAYELRDQFVADPDFSDVPVDRLISRELADGLRGRISPDRAMIDIAASAGPIYRDTIYLTVIDRDQNACSFINSIYFSFGAAITDPATGILFQNRGAGFRLEENHPNCLAGGKRPLHTIIPAMLMKDGRAQCSFGVMGGSFQPVGHVHVATNMIDYGMDPQAALDFPRAFHVEGVLDLEQGVSDSVAAELAAKGHSIGRPDMPWGGGQAIWIDHQNGTLVGGSDPRKDGAAIGW